MRFLLNMNLPRELGVKLSAKGHKCRHVGDIGLAKAKDKAILEEAKSSREIIMTHDLDYGNLLAFSGEKTPSVIIFRVRNTHSNNLFAQVMDAWTEIEKPLLEGAIIILEDSALRIRRLPITPKKKIH